MGVAWEIQIGFAMAAQCSDAALAASRWRNFGIRWHSAGRCSGSLSPNFGVSSSIQLHETRILILLADSQLGVAYFRVN